MAKKAWNCVSCSAFNWSRKVSCFYCGAAKPTSFPDNGGTGKPAEKAGKKGKKARGNIAKNIPADQAAVIDKFDKMRKLHDDIGGLGKNIEDLEAELACLKSKADMDVDKPKRLSPTVAQSKLRKRKGQLQRAHSRRGGQDCRRDRETSGAAH